MIKLSVDDVITLILVISLVIISASQFSISLITTRHTNQRSHPHIQIDDEPFLVNNDTINNGTNTGTAVRQSELSDLTSNRLRITQKESNSNGMKNIDFDFKTKLSSYQGSMQFEFKVYLPPTACFLDEPEIIST